MENSMSGAFEPGPWQAPPPAAVAAPAEPTMAIVFSASGSEYFRIWIVNLLLSLVTLGLYRPWAKVRRLRYFYGNTSLGGHALDFHGDPKRMLRGLLLVGALVALYSLAGRFSPLAGLVAFLIVAAVWPALFRASQQFRMRNTSWRGLRFGFDGSMGGAYAAMLPFFVPGLLTVTAAVVVSRSVEDVDDIREAIGGIVLGVSAVFALAVPLLLWWLKRYQHGHYRLGELRTSFGAGPGSYYLLGLKTFGIGLLAALAMVVVALLLMIPLGLIGAAGSLFSGGGKTVATVLIFAIGTVVAIVAYGGVLSIMVPYVTTRLQNLVWNATVAPGLRFESRLSLWPMVSLTLKNWLLILITLGLYMPFAQVAMARLRLQAVKVVLTLPPEQIMAAMQAQANDATGDAAGDFFGIDIGL